MSYCVIMCDLFVNKLYIASPTRCCVLSIFVNLTTEPFMSSMKLQANAHEFDELSQRICFRVFLWF